MGENQGQNPQLTPPIEDAGTPNLPTARGSSSSGESEGAELRPDPSADGAPARRSDLGIVGTQLSAAAFAYLWSMLIVAALDLFTWQFNWRELPSISVGTRGLVFLISSLIVWLIIMLAVSLTNRLWIPLAVASALAGLAGFANLQKLQVRHEPIYPSDLVFAQQGGFLVEMVGWREILLTFAALIVVAFAVLGLGRVLSKPFYRLTRSENASMWRTMLIVRLCLAVSIVLILNSATHFNASGNPVRGLYERAGIHWAWWSQQINYQGNGFVAGYLYNLDVPPMEAPSGYSQATMESIVAKYRHRAKSYNKGRSTSLLPTMNIVVILSEAFSDPYKDLNGISIAADPIPFTRSLMAQTTSGHMLAQYYGGGTANMEFEALTSLSLSQFQPQLNTPFQQLIPKYPTFPSVVPYLEQHGLNTLAIHPYNPTFYRRNEVYPRLGIDRFISESGMSHSEIVGDKGFVSDKAAFGETLAALRDDADPLFINVVTMQNHVPTSGKYADPWPVEGVSGDSLAEAEGYLRGLNYSDQALRDFISALKELDEPTAVVFYGDHLPGIWPQSITVQNPGRGLVQTPYFLWTNFTTINEPQPPMISPIYFLPTLFDQVGLPLPPYYVLLKELEEYIPAMELSVAMGPDGEILTDDDLSEEARSLLRDYALVEYDLVAGQRYSLDGLFYPTQVLEQATAPVTDPAP